MRQTVTLPKLGDTVSEVVVLECLVDVGQKVSMGQPVLRVETEKIETEVDSPFTGVLIDLLVAEDDEISTGAAIFVVDQQAS